MSVVRNQQQTYLRLAARLQPHWRSDLNLPARIQHLLTRSRSFGARDRRLYRELIYTTLRFLPWVEPWLERDPDRATKIVSWLAADTRDTRSFRAGIAGDWPAAAALQQKADFLEAEATALLPSWFRTHCPEVYEPGELEAQLRRAPFWLRLQAESTATLEQEFEDRGWRVQKSAALASAWQLLDEADVTQTDAYKRGDFEVQDLGSQLVLESIGIKSGDRWLDACAGAGGKSLQLARLLGPDGAVDACDIRGAALNELKLRAARAGLKTIRVADQPSAGGYAGVLVDAPCSGSGTWRRSPHLKWTTPPALVESKARLQLALLAQNAAYVRPGGALVYATCSLSREENEQVVAQFLDRNPDFAVAPLAHAFGFAPRGGGLTILPSRHDTDGFFVASLKRK